MRFLKLGRAKKDDPLGDLGDYELPDFSASALRCLEVLRDDESSAQQIADAVAVDPGLSVRLLRHVHSAALGLRSSVTDLGHAVALLGRASVESLVIAVAIRDALPMEGTPHFDATRFWRTAAVRAAVAARLAEVAFPALRSQAFTAALLCDMAVPFLAAKLGEEYGSVLARWEAGEGPLHALEAEAFGWDHAQLGGRMCEVWKVPAEISVAIAEHHSEGGGTPVPVRLTAGMSGWDPESDAVALVETASRELSMDREAVEELIAAGLQDAEEFVALLT